VNSSWTIEWDDAALKALKKLARPAQKQIIHYLETRIQTKENPRRFGEGLIADKKGLWRYRVGDYRVICRIEDEIVCVLVVDVGHRKNIYN